MNNNRYILEPNKGASTRHTCFACVGLNKFTRYVDNKTGVYLPEKYGKCDEKNCRYHLNPYSNGYVQMKQKQEEEQNSTLKTLLYNSFKNMTKAYE